MYFQYAESHPDEARQEVNPIETNPRRQTDRSCVSVFSLILIVWLVIVILGFCTSDGKDDRFDQIIKHIISPIPRPVDSTFMLLLLISVVGIFLYTLLAEKITKIVVWIGFGLYLITTIGSCLKSIAETLKVLSTVYLARMNNWIFVIFLLIGLIWTWFITMYMFTSTFSFIKTDKKILYDIARDSCRIILRSPLLVLFMALMTILASLVVFFTSYALFFGILSERNEFLRDFYSIVILFGGFCALLFIFSFAVMVVSEYAINYYWKEDEKSEFLLGRSIVSTSRNHIGTIMFASTVFVSLICAIVQAFRHKPTWKRKENSMYYFATKIHLALGMTETALIFASIYGTDFVKSSQKAFDVVLRQPPIFLAVLVVYEGVFLLIPTLVLMIVFIITILAPMRDQTTEEDMIINISLFLHGLIYPFICFASLMFFTMKALLINKIIILNKKDQDTEGMANILHDV